MISFGQFAREIPDGVPRLVHADHPADVDSTRNRLFDVSRLVRHIRRRRLAGCLEKRFRRGLAPVEAHHVAPAAGILALAGGSEFGHFVHHRGEAVVAESIGVCLDLALADLRLPHRPRETVASDGGARLGLVHARIHLATHVESA